MVVLRKIGAVVLGVLAAWVVAFIVTRLLANALYPGFTGQLELASSGSGRILLTIAYLGVWIVGGWYAVRFLLRRAG